MTNQTVATVSSLNEAAEERQNRRGSKIPPYPGGDERHYKLFWLGTKEKHNEVEVIFTSNPIQVLCYRTAVESVTNKGRTWPGEALHISPRYILKNVDGLLIKKTKEGVSDLYADCFGDIAEKWTIIPCLVRTPSYDNHGNREKFVGGAKNGKPAYRESFRFIELGPSCDALRVIADKMEHPFFAKSGQGLVGSHWIIHKKGKNPPREGHWDLKTKKTETGTQFIQHGIKKLFKYIVDKANEDIPKAAYEQGERKMYVSKFEEAYPIANVDQQRLVLQLHAELLNENPDFDKRFPAMLKRFGADGELTGVTLDDEKVEDLDDEGETTEGEVSSISDLDDDGDSVNFDDDEGGGETETGDTETVTEDDEGDVFYANGIDEKGGFELKDGTPCDEDGNPITNKAEEDVEEEDVEEEDAEEEDAEEEATTSEDPQQDAGIADEGGDTSAFDFEKESAAKVEEKAKPKKRVAKKREKEEPAAEPAKKKAVKKKAAKA